MKKLVISRVPLLSVGKPFSKINQINGSNLGVFWRASAVAALLLFALLADEHTAHAQLQRASTGSSDFLVTLQRLWDYFYGDVMPYGIAGSSLAAGAFALSPQHHRQARWCLMGALTLGGAYTIIRGVRWAWGI